MCTYFFITFAPNPDFELELIIFNTPYTPVVLFLYLFYLFIYNFVHENETN